MMLFVRACVFVVVAVAIAALHHQLADPIVWELEANAPGPPPGVDPAGAEAPAPPDAAPDSEDVVPPAPASDGGDDEQATDAPTEVDPYSLGMHVDLAGARALFELAQDGDAAIIDARRLDEYVQGHIAGAVHIPPGAFRGAIPDATNWMNRNAPVLIYCTGGDCTDSKNVGIRLQEMGFTRIHIFDEGYGAWADAGYETVSGESAW